MTSTPNTSPASERVPASGWNGRGGWLEGPDALKPWVEHWPDDADIGKIDAEMVRQADRVPWTYSRSPAGASQRRIWWLQRQRDRGFR